MKTKLVPLLAVALIAAGSVSGGQKIEKRTVRFNATAFKHFEGTGSGPDQGFGIFENVCALTVTRDQGFAVRPKRGKNASWKRTSVKVTKN